MCDPDDPPGSAEPREAVPGEDVVELASRGQEASSPGVGRPWVRTFLAILAILHLVSFVLLLYTGFQ